MDITYTTPKLKAVLTDQIWRRDCYGIKQIPEQPDVVLDIGANVGSFSLFAKSVWPDAKIVALEPFPSTYSVLQQNIKGTDIQAFNLALGNGYPVHLVQGADSGSNRTSQTQEGPMVNTITLQDLVRSQVPPGGTYMIKLDCEGGEWGIWQDPVSLSVLLKACAVSAELHYKCGKWPDAPAIEEAEAMVKDLRKQWAGVGDYHRLGTRAGMLILRRDDV